MFDKQYRFRGSHALMVEKLTANFDPGSTAKLFEHNYRIYLAAPLIGFLYGRTAEQNNDKNPETNQVYDQNIFAEQVISHQDDLMFHFCLIMLLDEKYTSDKEARIDKAFRHLGEDPKDEERFDAYVRGGVEVLYEKLIEGPTDPGDYVTRLHEFVEDFHEKFYANLSKTELLALSKK